MNTSVRQVGAEKDHYLEAFESFLKRAGAKDPSWLSEIRKAAIARFQALGFPTMREEHWRYTNVNPIKETNFKPILDPVSQGLTSKQIELLNFRQKDWHRLVFVNGIYQAELSSIGNSQNGLKLGNLKPGLVTGSKLLEEHLTRYARFDQNSFTALNTAFIHDGAFIYVPEAKELKEPIHLIFISRAENGSVLSQPRTLIVAGKGSKATVIESYVSLGEGRYFTNAVTEIAVQENATIDYYKLTLESDEGFHIGTTQVRQDQGSKFSSSSLAFKGKLVRNNLVIGLDSEDAECALNGLYVLSGEQHVDNWTLIDHPKPHGTSRQLYKGILSGKSSAVFSGKIFVRPGADRTDAEQTNKNLLLSDEATVDTKPQLEILADDVKCTHGAAVGQLDEAAIFYLKTRGLSHEAASKLLSYGFANEVIDKIKVEPLRSELNRLIFQKLEDPSFFGVREL